MSRSKKLPALHLYPGDWKKDLNVQSLDFLSRHVWFECLLLMHDSEERGVLILNGKPLVDDQIARLIGLDIPTTTDCLTKIRESGTCGIREDGAIFSRRMVRDEQKRLIAVENGSKGGNPNLVNPSATGKKNLSNRNAENENEIVNENGSKDLDPKKNGTAFTPSGKYDTPTIQKYIPIIQAKLKANGRTFDEIAFEALCMRLGNDIPRIEKALVFTASLTKVLNVVEPGPQNHTSSAVKKTSLDVLNEISAGLK